MKNKYITAIISLIFGGFGLHHLYLGDKKKSALYAIFFWTMIPVVLSIIDALYFLLMNQEKFNQKYNAVTINQPNPISLQPTNKTSEIESQKSSKNHYLSYVNYVNLLEIETNQYPAYSYNWYIKNLIALYRTLESHPYKKDTPEYSLFKDYEYQINYLNISNDLPIIDYWDFFSVALNPVKEKSIQD